MLWSFAKAVSWCSGCGLVEPESLHARMRMLSSPLQIVVQYQGHRAEAQLQLPSVAVRSHDDTPPGLWLTVGLLATDGLALQLRLKRADKVRAPHRLMRLSS